MSRDQTLHLSPFNSSTGSSANTATTNNNEGGASPASQAPNRVEESAHSLRIMSTQMPSGVGGGGQSQETNANICAGCGLLIWDRTMLNAMEQNWHNHCLKCHCCGGRLGEMGTSLFHRGNMLLCRQDYLK